jgi:hypothetical protein
MSQLAIDFTQARAARDDGIQRAVDHADADAPGWSTLAYNFLVEYARTHERLQIWMVNQESKKVIPVPENEKAWAGPTQKAIKRGIIKKIGFAPNPKRHATDAPVYQSLLYVEPAREREPAPRLKNYIP